VKQLRERLRVQNMMKNIEGFFLGFPRGLDEAGHKLLKDWVVLGNSTNRRFDGPIWLKMSNRMKGTLKPLKDVRGHVLKVIVPKAIERPKQPGRYGKGVPRGRREGGRQGVGNVDGIDGVEERLPASIPSTQGDPRGSKHGGTIHS